ncbi:MAG: Lpg1974 family pore-forming outer membrane protein [Gammaproteobacteria bacterium]|nr:Lpg1974 family pore-forming outer membrane protein [Gammaproteobacteria bacterium]
MFKSTQIFLTISLSSLILSYPNIGAAAHATNVQKPSDTSPTAQLVKESFNNKNPTSFSVGLLYIQPYSSNLKYATFVSGVQPYYQSWHYQEIKPSYHPAFELAFNLAVPNTLYSAGVNWVHLNSNDTSSKRAATSTNLMTVEFVAPPYEMSPPVFGIKTVNSKVNFEFDNVLLNAGRLVEFDSHVRAKFFGGLSLLKLNQNVTTTFSNYAGSPPTAYSYALPPDPSFSFRTENVSKYLGVGPDLGLSVQYKMDSGFGFMGEFLGMLTTGTIQAQDNFTSTSARLTTLGIGTSHQNITTPNATQVVLGLDGKLGVFYNYRNFTIEAGYRMVSYLNAISTINPSTLVQPGTVFVTPEFSTGTMAIVSTDARNRPFSFSGPFVNVKLAIA